MQIYLFIWTPEGLIFDGSCHMQDMKFVITVPTDALAPNNAMPSADTF